MFVPCPARNLRYLKQNMKEKGPLQLLEQTDHSDGTSPEECAVSVETEISDQSTSSGPGRKLSTGSVGPGSEPSLEAEIAYLRERVEAPDPSLESPLKKEDKRPEIRVRHSIHDRFQVERNLTFDLRPRSKEETRREFKVDLYLYVPFSVGINSSSFTAAQFFRHWTSYFRVRAPQFYHLRVLPPEELRFGAADSYFEEHLDSLKRRQLGPRVVQDVKLFGNFLYTELKKLNSTLRRRKLRKVKPERSRATANALAHRVALLWSMRERYLDPMRAGKYLVDDEVERAFVLTDEYLSYRAELVLLRGREQFSDRREEFDELLKREMEYRETHDLLILSEEEESPVAFEAYTYRLGLLKKYLGEALFLKTTSSKKDDLYKNYVAAIGAGLAATVAGLAEHQRVQYLTGNDSGLRLAFLIGVAVVAYIFKDRVKDLSKEYFNSRLKERLPDQRFLLSHSSVTSEGEEKNNELGVASEYFRFVKEVPADVAYLRSLGQTRKTDPIRREHVMHLARRLQLELHSENASHFPLLKNIVRLDVSPFLSKLDNPTTPVSFLGRKGKAKTAAAPKVYHLNGIVRYETTYGTDPVQTRVDYERFRVVLDKNGIVRLDNVMPSGRLAYQETRS